MEAPGLSSVVELFFQLPNFPSPKSGPEFCAQFHKQHIEILNGFSSPKKHFDSCVLIVVNFMLMSTYGSQ